MRTLSLALALALAEAATVPDKEEEILGRKVRFYARKWHEDGKEYASWSYEIDGGPRSTGSMSLLSIARDAAKKAIQKLDATRDRGGQYTHRGDWERICKCGHPLSKHTGAALAGGMRDCMGCEEEGKDGSHHRFVEKKPKKEKP